MLAAAVRTGAVTTNSGTSAVSVGIPLYGGCTMSTVTSVLLSIGEIRRQQDEQE